MLFYLHISLCVSTQLLQFTETSFSHAVVAPSFPMLRLLQIHLHQRGVHRLASALCSTIRAAAFMYVFLHCLSCLYLSDDVTFLFPTP